MFSVFRDAGSGLAIYVHYSILTNILNVDSCYAYQKLTVLHLNRVWIPLFIDLLGQNWS